jgi:microcin C transport system substrate-binding protein
MMRNHLASLLLAVVALSGCITLVGCRSDSEQTTRTSGFDEFVPQYNAYIREWILGQQKASLEKAEELATKISSAEGDSKATLELEAEVVRQDLEKWKYRLGIGDFIKTGTPSEIPTDLVWLDGMEQPEIGDPAATKGGVFRRFIPTFPPTIRPFGDNSNNSFRGDLYDYIDLPLVNLHPETMEPIPGVAHQWAVSPDGRTIYFRIDPDATYSDGVPILAKDYQISLYLRVSDNIVNPYHKQYYRENLAQVAVYDDRTLSISIPEAKIYAPAIAGAMLPSPPHFYQDYGPDYNERYQWLFPPTSGAYTVESDDIIKGVSITQTRVQNWWAKDKKYYKYRFNPDKLVNTVVRDESKAFELFRAGQLDTFYLTRPEYWYEKSEMPPVYDGYIERVTYYNRYPKVPRGLYLNVSKKPLDNLDVRIGINHAINWQKVIDVIFRGDFQRLNAFNEGYLKFSDPTIIARPYSIKSARESFAKAGYTQEGRDGILRNSEGKKLSISVTYPAMPAFDGIFALLREEAKSCGLDLRLDGLEATVAYKKQMQKQHEMTLGSWLIGLPVPDFHQFLHSSNAFDEKGNPKPQTNNTFAWGRPDTDRLSLLVRTARTEEELRDATQKLQRIMHDEAIFVPGYFTDFMRIGSWRWVRWPDSEFTRFSPPSVYDPHEAFIFWIDEKIQQETQSARRTGKTFPESTRIVDDYRLIPGQPVENPPTEKPSTEPENTQPDDTIRVTPPAPPPAPVPPTATPDNGKPEQP